MKKILSFICVIALLCTVCVTLMPVEVSAAWHTGMSMTKNLAYVKDDVLHVTSQEAGINSTATKGFSLLADNYTLSFSMKVNEVKLGFVQGGTSTHRFGFYIQENRISTFDSAVMFNVPNMNNWHDYVIEIDVQKETQTIYIDEVLQGVVPMREHTGNRGALVFGTSQAPTHFEITDYKFSAPDAYPDHLLKLTTDYTEAFRQDWNEIDGWMVEGEKYVTHYPEEGVIRLNVDRENLTYRSIERPLRPPTNYDVEWRIKIPELAEGKQPGDTALELSTDNRHTWIHIEEDNVSFNNYGQNGDVPLYDGPIKSVQFSVGHDWHTWKAEVRDEYVTWYVDDKELVSYEMLKSTSNRWHLCIFQQNLATLTADILIDWIEYTPYFEDELTMISPVNGSVFYVDKPIDIKAEPTTAVDKVDYYVNGVYVGSGKRDNGYVYTLNNLKRGTYKVTAKVGEAETGDWTFTVRDSVVTKLSLDKTETTSAGVVNAGATIEGGEEIATVRYFSNGKMYAECNTAPFNAILSKLPVGTATVYAEIITKNGDVFTTDSKTIDVNYDSAQSFNIEQEYELSYNVENDGKIEINDGYFGLSLVHSGNKLTYKTFDGEKVYENVGKGEYRALVASGYVELYYNGHLLVTYYLPRANGKTVTNSGVSNFILKGSGAKNTLYRKELNGNGSFEDKNAPNAQIFALEFDKTDESTETMYYYDGRFENVLYFRNDGIYVKQQFLLGSEPIEYKISDSVKPGYYRLEGGYGIMQLFCDNQLLGVYKAHLSSKMPTVKREMTNPSATTLVTIKDTNDIYYHSEDFEGKTEFAGEEYWQATYETFRTASNKIKATKVTEENGNSYMNLKGSGAYILNAISDYPSLKWRGMFKNPQGKAYVMLRRSFSDTHNKIGYDFDKGEWFFEWVPQAGGSKSVRTKAAPEIFKTNKWYNFELVCEGLDVVILVDGVEAFCATMENLDKQLIYYGRLGFGAIDSEWNVDDIEYMGCGKATAGFAYTSTGAIPNASNVGTYYKQGDAVYASYLSEVLKTTDRGRSWTTIKKAADSSNIYTADYAELPDGTIVIMNDNGNVHTSSVSHDGGKTWEGPYTICDYGQTGTVDRLNATLDGRVFACFSEGTEWFGHVHIFYSDDGINWTKSETVISTFNTGGVVPNEAFVVDTPRKDEVWMYSRSNTGFVTYWISKDNGKTFDLTTHNSQLMQCAVTPRVRRDRNNPDVYYAWHNQDSTAYAQTTINHPRTRPSLAVSYDGMETWHNIETVMESTTWLVGRTSDASFAIAGDQLYWRTTNQDASGGILMGVQDIDKIKPSMRLPGFHKRTFWGYDALDHFMVNHVVLPKADGKAWVYCDYSNVKVENGRIDAETCEKVFGVTATASGNTITLTIGDGKLTFTEGATSYDANGAVVSTDSAVLQGGKLSVSALANIFGKVYKETETSYILMQNSEAVDVYQNMIETFM